MKKAVSLFAAVLIALQLVFGITPAVCAVTVKGADSQSGFCLPDGRSGGEDIIVRFVEKNLVFADAYSYPYTASSLSLTNNANKYGYNDLALRSNGTARQKLYNKLLECAEKFASDGSNVNNYIEDKQKNKYYYIGSFDIAALGLSHKEAIETWTVFRNDNPIYYWISNTVTVSADMSELYLVIYDDYLLGSVRAESDAAVEKALAEYKSLTDSFLTDLEKAVTVHDKLCEDTEYAYESGSAPSDAASAHNIIGVFEYNSAVCEGYAKAYQLIMTYIGVDCIYVTGEMKYGENHAWDIIKLSDGEWHVVDVTWDDTTVDDDYSHTYFGLANDIFADSHIIDTPESNGVKFLYALPAISNVTYELVKLYTNGTYTMIYSGFTQAFAAMTDADAEYKLQLYKHANRYTLPEGAFPDVKSICIEGNKYISAQHSSQGFYVDKLFMNGDIKTTADIELKNIDMQFYMSVASSAEINLNGAGLILSGEYCRIYSDAVCSNDAYVELLADTVHFYGSIQSDKIITNGSKCSLYGTVKGNIQLVVKEGVKEIRQNMLAPFTMVKSISIPSTVDFISSTAFKSNTSITQIDVDENNSSYMSADGVLYKKDTSGNAQTLVSYPAAKAGENYKTIYGIKTIEDNAFANAANLKSIIITSGCTSVGAGAFSGASKLEAVYVPSTVAAISSQSFANTEAAIYAQKTSYAEKFADNNSIEYYPVNEYTYTFYNDDKSIYFSQTGYENEIIVAPAAPEKPRQGYATYLFAGWKGYSENMALTADVSFTAEYVEILDEFKYVFYDENGNIISQGTLKAGEKIPAPDAPPKDSDKKYDYEFAGWEGYTAGMTIDGDIEFTATYTATVRKYTYRFYNEDGSKLLKEVKAEYGTVIEPPTAPEKPADKTIKYVFKGWKDYSDGMTLEGDIDFYAEYEESENMFTYTFYDSDGRTIIKRETVLYGTEIICPDDLTDIPDGYNAFIGWSGYEYGMTITKNIYFIAEYGMFENPCKYVFYDDDGSIVTKGVLEYGSVIKTPDDPQKASTKQYRYEFIGWLGYTDGMIIEKDSEFTAQYKDIIREYTYTFYDDDGTVILQVTAPYGTVIEPPEFVKENTQQYTYVFIRWADYSENMLLESDIDFYAEYEITENEYTYKFVDYDGTVISEVTAVYGTLIELPEPPLRKGYTFLGWNGYNEDMILEEDIVFEAMYEIFETSIKSDIYITDEDALYLKNVSAGTTFGEFLQNLTNLLDVKLFSSDGTEITDEDALVGTGMKVRLYAQDETVLQELTIIVAGDINGDGNITITDFVRIKAHLLSNDTALTGTALAAADFNLDGNVTITDFVRIKAILLAE